MVASWRDWQNLLTSSALATTTPSFFRFASSADCAERATGRSVSNKSCMSAGMSAADLLSR